MDRLLGWRSRLARVLQLFLQSAIGQHLGQDGLYGLLDRLLNRLLYRSSERSIQSIKNSVEQGLTDDEEFLQLDRDLHKR